MKTSPVWLGAIGVAALIAMATIASAAEPSKEDAALSAKLINAIANTDYDAFVEDGFPVFRHITKDRFESVCAELGPRLRAGYTVSYMGEFKRHGVRATLWKVSFTDGGDDALATMSVYQGRVMSFSLQ